jgi:hypothetical protein
MGMRILRDTVSNRDLAEYHVALDGHERRLFDTQADRESENSAQDVLTKLLSKMGIHMVEAARTQDKQLAQDKALAAKLASDPRIRQQELVDKGAAAAHSAVNQALEAHFKSQGTS